ncbi:hypothetical protein [Streptobacillus moniliformis]|uniref:hypothetical protein n=1 Tax=Streptobacillus moniliformis TaxID=34105 RepID=UPI0007E41EF1|nr:hypothetical protein [Streptobacillus moniliformis]
MKLQKENLKYILILFALLLSIYLSYENVNEYHFKKDKIILSNKKLEEIEKIDEVVEKVEYKKDEEIEKILIEDNDFLKSIFYFSNYSNLKLIDSSKPIIKEEDKYFERVNVVFKLNGSLVNFYEFLQYVFYADNFIDNREIYMILNGEYFEISLGYYREKL